MHAMSSPYENQSKIGAFAICTPSTLYIQMVPSRCAGHIVPTDAQGTTEPAEPVSPIYPMNTLRFMSLMSSVRLIIPIKISVLSVFPCLNGNKSPYKRGSSYMDRMAI